MCDDEVKRDIDRPIDWRAIAYATGQAPNCIVENTFVFVLVSNAIIRQDRELALY